MYAQSDEVVQNITLKEYFVELSILVIQMSWFSLSFVIFKNSGLVTFCINSRIANNANIEAKGTHQIFENWG